MKKMSNTKSTKRALLTSVMAVVLCLAMLIGTTFAWFTSTDSAKVNKIQSGTLKIELLDKDEKPIDDRMLNWKTADDRAQDKILWEPGCTYELEPVTIKNDGNLALKYKIEISGIAGSEKLNEVIDWTIKVNGEEKKLAEYEGHLDPKDTETASAVLTISGKMQTTADNEYQDLSIDGIAITVVATQDTVEEDSIDNQYDAQAQYPVSSAADVKTAIRETGNVTLLNDVELNSIIKPTTPVVSISAVDKDNPVTITTPEMSYSIAFTPSSETDPYFTENNEFTLNLSNVTMKNGTGGKTSVVLGQVSAPVLTGKTLNINGGTFETYSAQANGAISIMSVDNCVINISDATFIAGHSSSTQYGSFITLLDQASLNPATNVTVNFTNCTFKLIDGEGELDPETLKTEDPSLFARLFWVPGETNSVNFN